jgi:zinc protease
MRKLIIIANIWLLFALSAYAGETHQITLDNGMVVILKENHSTPMVASIVCVRTGSKFEDQSNNGFTHFLEHLLFNGTDSLDRIELNEGFKDHGGYINAFTQKDLTGYLFVIPSIYSEYALKTQADQLFNSTLPESEFPKERKIVIEEIKMNYDDPDNQAEMFFDSLIYQGTPYARTVLGPIDVIETIPREKVLAYYKERYLPNNMIALFIGDFKSEEFAKLVNKYYGKPQRGVLPAEQTFAINPPYTKSIHSFEYSGEITKIHCVFPAPRYDDPDYYAIDMLAQILDSGESSPLYKTLTQGDDPLVNEMSFYLEANKDFSLLHFTASLNDPQKIERVVSVTAGFLAGLTDTPFDEKTLKRIVTKNKTDKIYLEEKLHYYGIMQAPMLVNFGYDYINNYVKNLSQVTPSDISKAAHKYLGQRKFLAMAAIPSAGEEN